MVYLIYTYYSVVSILIALLCVYHFFFFFFFQAEDGIRDTSVTGVQTCALPIYPKSFAAMRYTESKMTRFAQSLLSELEQGTTEWGQNFDGTLKEPKLLPSRRSEERRVGKECRSRWAQDHEKKREKMR